LNQPTSVVRGVSDTALWVAYFRARETQRADALFHDPYAERLAGERGFSIANTLRDGNKQEWAWVSRTYLFDQFILSSISRGADLILNLAAGLDARPYRLELPRSLQWVEVDLPELISYKQEVLAGETPRCQLRRVSLDLSELLARKALFDELNTSATKIAVISEGLLIYFASESVAALATDLASGKHFASWVIDLASAGQLKLMQRTTGKDLSQAGAPFKFGPSEGPDFFLPYGWNPKEVRGMLKTAAEFGRAPLELLSLLPEPQNRFGAYPWTGVCLLERSDQ
jgi:methyltransferase (TIGR00027 family)